MAFYVIEVIERRHVLVEAASEDDATEQAEDYGASDLINNEVETCILRSYETSDKAWAEWGIDVDLTEENK